MYDRPLYQAELDVLFGPAPDIFTCEWVEPDLDELTGLDHLDEAVRRDPSLADDPNFLDAYESDSLAELGHLPRVRWYRDAKQRQRLRRQRRRHERLTKAWASKLELHVWTYQDHDALTLDAETRTEEFASSQMVPKKVRVGKDGRVAVFDKAGRIVPSHELRRDTVTNPRYTDRTVSEAKIFNPVPGDGLTLDEILAEMTPMVAVREQDGEFAVDRDVADDQAVDHRYLPAHDARREIRRLRTVVECADLKAKAVEICRFPWSDAQADSDPERARGHISRSKLHEWGNDTWQVIVTRKRLRKPMPDSGPRHLWHRVPDSEVKKAKLDGVWMERSLYTVFVRTHVGDHTVVRRGKPDLQVWDWDPHYFKVFHTETDALNWKDWVSDAFLREQQGDLDMLRWPQNLVEDRSMAAAQARKHDALWRQRDAEGWKFVDVGLRKQLGEIDFVPGEHNAWDPYFLQQVADGEPPVPEPAE